jgi:hypothetical protein
MKATLGLSVSGKYLVVVARESDAPVVRLQLWKQRSKGFDFGFNLDVGVQGDVQLPRTYDDFVKAVFGVHGLQVVKEVRAWTDPATTLGQKIAGLADQTAIDLLKQTTGIDAAAEFEAARQKLRGALDAWAGLPAKLQAMLWGLLPGPAAGGASALRPFLAALKDPQTAAAELARALGQATFGETPEGRFLEAIAETGLLTLKDRLRDVSQIAGTALDVIDGGLLARLQAVIDQKLDLDQIRKVATDTDFAKVDGWLQERLATFIDRRLALDDLKDVQKAIRTLDERAADYYKAGVEALTKKYSFELAALYQSTTTDTALVDVEFDLRENAAAALFAEIAGRGALDDLLTRDTDGVTLHQAALTHGISRRGEVDINLPRFDFTGTHVNDAVAKLTVEEQGGRVLVYQVTASDKETAKSRASSQLAVVASLTARPGTATLTNLSGSIAYEMRQVKADMRPVDLEARTAAFIHDYLGELFSEDASARTFFADLDIALSAATRNASNRLGDMAVSMQLSLPATVFAGWLEPRDAGRLRADQARVSRALQVACQTQLPALYFRDARQYVLNESTAALLVWASLPVSTSIALDGHALRFNTDADVFWDWPDASLRRAVARDGRTIARLAGRLAGIRVQLQEMGQRSAGDFDPAKANRFVEQALNPVGDQLLSSLLFSTAQLVRGAGDALARVSAATAMAGSAPGRAIEALAEFAGTVTETFNQKVQTVYSGVSGRVIGPMLLVEATAALGTSVARPDAMLALCALKPGHAFDLGSFVDGRTPPQSDIALAQTLVRLR